MPYVERAGKPTLHYDLDDYTDPWKKPRYILLQHGRGRSGRFWYSWVPYLSRYYRVIRPDMRGLGSSSKNIDPERDITLDEYIADLDAIIEHAGADAVHYCGESFGGAVGMAFAAEHPERVRTLTLIGAPVFINEHDKQSTTYGHSSRIEAIRKMGVRAWAEASTAGRRFPPDTDPGMLQWFVDELGKEDAEVLIAMFRWISSYSAVPYLPRIKAPVLGLYAAADPITDGEQLDLLKRHVPDVRIVYVDSRYHAIQSFEPAKCALEVLHFAAQHDGIACHE